MHWPPGFPLEGHGRGVSGRFPLLLKFLDCKEMLSVQVHPSDAHKEFIPAGETSKTEAWVVLEAGPSCRIYAGLKPGTNAQDLREALASETALADHLQGFVPTAGQGFFIPAGTVHSLGGDVVVFEIQQNSDVTFRLSDWGHVDPKTGRPRELQVEQAMACVDYGTAPYRTGCVPGLVEPVIEGLTPLRERLFLCEHFELWRLSVSDAAAAGDLPFSVGAADTPTVLVCIDGDLQLEHAGLPYAVARGDVLLLPASIGPCLCRARGAMSLLEISIP